jgi:hypothetical protein
MPIASPALLQPIGRRFRQAVLRFAADQDLPLIRFPSKRDPNWQRQIDLVRPYLDAAERAGDPRVVAIGVAQEFQHVFTAYQHPRPAPLAPRFAFQKAERRVTCYYFYFFDDDFGPGFIKLCAYFPYPGKVWLNGHEWAKRQATKCGLRFTALANGFASCDDPELLQALCDRLGANHILACFDRWMRVIPTPLTAADRAAGYWWELSMRQVEVSRTLVLDAPRHARQLVEAIAADNLDLGRPDQVELIFSGRPVRRGRPIKRPETFKTKVVRRGVELSINVFYKHSRLKQYLKEGRALRLEVVVNAPGDLGVHHLRLTAANLRLLVERARAVNHRLLMLERAGQGCAIESALFERISLPYVREGQHAAALRFGDHRATALAGALAHHVHAVAGFTNRSLRALVAGLLGTDYSARQMTYDLRRLRLKGLIARIEGSHRYVVTSDGVRFAIFYTRLSHRVLAPLFARQPPNAPPPLRRALGIIDRCVHDQLTAAGLTAAA